MTNGSSKDRFFLCVGVSAQKPSDDERLRRALSEISNRDPQVRVNLGTTPGLLHQVEGESKSQLDSVCDRLRTQYLAINVDRPKPVLLETIRETSEGEAKYIRQAGGLGNYGHCRLRLEPNERGGGYSFASLVPSDVMPEEYVRAVDCGVQAAMQLGVLSRYPVVDLMAFLIDGSYHAEDSNPLAFEIAGSIALQQAARRASPVVLEPVVMAKFQVPELFSGTIVHEVTRRRGRIVEIRDECSTKDDLSSSSGTMSKVHRRMLRNWYTARRLREITAILPLSELLAWEFSELGALTMKLVGYEDVPDEESPDENTSGVTANKPNHPQSRRGLEAIRPEEEE